MRLFLKYLSNKLVVCVCLFCCCCCFQRVVRVKKTDEIENDDLEISEEDIEALSQGIPSTITLNTVLLSVRISLSFQRKISTRSWPVH